MDDTDKVIDELTLQAVKDEPLFDGFFNKNYIISIVRVGVRIGLKYAYGDIKNIVKKIESDYDDTVEAEFVLGILIDEISKH